MSDELTPAPKKTKTNTKSIPETYAVGEYVTADDWIYLKVIAVIPNDGNPIYGVVNQKSKKKIQWHSQAEFNHSNTYKGTPDFAFWNTIAPGDMVRIGVTPDRAYVKVLARVGDAVLLSMTPSTRKERETYDKLTSQIEELTDGAIEKKELQRSQYLPQSVNEAHSFAANEWMSTTSLALMHWTLIKEDE